MEIKDILSQRRKELNMTMKQVADKVGVSEGSSPPLATMKKSLRYEESPYLRDFSFYERG